jgi:hypothetical protein
MQHYKTLFRVYIIYDDILFKNVDHFLKMFCFHPALNYKQKKTNVHKSYLRPGSNAVLMVCFDSLQYTAEEKASTRATAKSNFRVWLDICNAYAAISAS